MLTKPRVHFASDSYTHRPCQANDARRSAVEEVERLLQHPEDLKRLPALREEYSQKQQACVPRPAHAALPLPLQCATCLFRFSLGEANLRPSPSASPGAPQQPIV